MDEKKKRVFHAVQSAFLTVVALIAFIAACIAWFANNTKVSGGGMQIGVAGSRFELATEGTQGRYDDDGAYIEGDTDETKRLYQTSNSKTLVAWMTSDDSNFQNQKLMDENGNSVFPNNANLLHPGASGEITFYVIPMENDITSMTFTLNYIPYEKVDQDTDVAGKRSMNKTVFNADGTTSQEKIDVAPLDEGDDQFIYDLLKGHILFFQKKENNIYSERINMEDGVTFTWQQALETKTPQKITLYWVWPMMFSNYMSDGIMDNAAQEQMIADMSDDEKKFWFFYKDTDSTLSQIPNVVSTMSNKDKTTCATYYNAADEVIGAKVRLLLLQLSAEENDR